MAVSETATIGSSGDFIRASFLQNVTAKGRVRRMLELAQAALEDLKFGMELPGGRRTTVFMGLPDRVDLSDADASAFVKLFRAGLLPRVLGFEADVHSFRQGRSAFFFALAAASESISSNHCDVAIVGSVDSLCSPDLLASLDAARRISSPVAPQGLIPGEGAGFALLERSQLPSTGRGEAQALLLCVSSGHEERHSLQSLPCTARALTRVLRALSAHPDTAGRRADILYTCEPGERFWSEEVAMAYLRNTSLMPEPFVRTMAGEVFGDAGAAAGSVLLGMGLHALARRGGGSVQAGPMLLLCGSSDRGQVGACLLQGPVPRDARAEGQP